VAERSGQTSGEIRAELAALREGEERCRSILRNAPGVIVAADRDGTVTFVNRTFSGIPPERVVGTSVFDYVLPEYRETVQDAFARALGAGETVTYELIWSGQGVPISVENCVGPLVRDGRIVGGRSSLGHHRAQARRGERCPGSRVQNAQRLESLGILAGGVAHDFNNLLVVILGHADLALMDIEPHARYRGSIEQIKLAARRASELTHQMLLYAGRGTPGADPLDLSALVGEMESLLAVSISKKIALEYQCDGEAPLVHADASQIRQVVMNLIINASEAIGDRDGTIRVRIGEAHLDQQAASRISIGEDLPAGRYASLEVSDTGSGIDAAARSRLFDPFFTTKVAGDSAAWCWDRPRHRGAIEVPAEPGELPILLPGLEGGFAARADDRVSRGPGLRGGGTILVADDEEGVREVAREMLERQGFRVIAVEDGREAVRVFQAVSEEIDAVLLDVSMPHLGGGEVLREMRRLRSDVKAILCSGYMERRARELCDGPSQASFLRKPFDSETLMGALREILVSRAQEEPDDRDPSG
jgi:PAS domain S-box-containing protein